jgi:hypothetical protein
MHKATPTVALCVRIDLDTEERRQRLLEELNINTPELVRRAFRTLEAVASETAETTAAT